MKFFIDEDRGLMLDLEDGSDSTKIDCSDLDLGVDDGGYFLIYTNVKAP